MLATTVVSEDDHRRAGVEGFIREVYMAEYAARLERFPATLVARFDASGEVLCAAGLRAHDDGFFSECYLDRPIDQVLSDIAAGPVSRGEIFEVSNLASRQPRAIVPFIFDIIGLATLCGYRWSFFTLTSRLKRMIEYFGIGPILLGRADPLRVANRADWGSYYAQDPCVFATRHAQLSDPILTVIQDARHAVHP